MLVLVHQVGLKQEHAQIITITNHVAVTLTVIPIVIQMFHVIVIATPTVILTQPKIVLMGVILKPLVIHIMI